MAHRAKDILYYDGACGMCRATMMRLRRIDWLHRLDFVDSTSLTDAELPVSREATLTGIPMRTRAGRVLMGHDAVRRALRQTPLGFLPALLMHIPGVSHAGRAVYAHIARKRQRDGVACEVRG